MNKPFVFSRDYPLIVAEVAQSHEGSLGMAHAFIDAAAVAGADAIKFQIHIPEAESTIDEPFRVFMSTQDKTRYEYWQRMAFTLEQWQELKNHASEKNIIFLASVFSLQSFQWAQKLGVKLWKVSSGEIYDEILLKEIISLEQPIVVSTGMASFNEIDRVCSIIKNWEKLCLLQCTSQYPTRLQDVGLNVITELRNRYQCAVGLSDHSGTIFPALEALSMGVSYIELHVTFSREMYGPDVKSSITFEDLKLISSIKKAREFMLANPVDKDAMAVQLVKNKEIFSKSIGFERNMNKGSVLKESDLVLRKPGTGISPKEISLVLGKKLQNNVKANKLLRWDDLENA